MLVRVRVYVHTHTHTHIHSHTLYLKIRFPNVLMRLYSHCIQLCRNQQHIRLIVKVHNNNNIAMMKGL